MTLTVEIPWPPKETSSNKGKSGNWWEKTVAAKSYKERCIIACIDQRIQKLDCDAVAVSIVYHPKTNGRVDWDNLAGRAKQGWDAISQVIGVDDGNWWPVTCDRGHKVKGGKIVVTITEKDAADWAAQIEKET